MLNPRAICRGIVLSIAIVSVLSIAPSAQTVGVPTAVTLLSYPNPSLPGMTVSLTAVVQTFYNPSLPPPTGNVAFKTEWSMNNPIGGILGPYQLLLGWSGVASSTAQFTDVPFALPYPYDLPFIIPSGTITACYSGDAIYAPSCGSVSQNVVPPDTTLTLISSSNPSLVGAPVQLSARVTAQGGVPSGVVKFTDATTGALLGSATLDATGRAVLPPTGLGSGVHVVQASYAPSPGSIYSGSTGILQQIVFGFPPG